MANDISSTKTQRAESESRFYDSYAAQLNVTGLQPLDVFARTCLENIYLLDQLGDLRGRRVLDIGCGQGDTSVYFATQGAEVYAVDVSAKMVEVTGQLAQQHGVGARLHGEVGRVEDLKYPDGFFDIIFGDGVLHHLDMQQAVPNLVRMLKPGGRGYFLEPQKGSIFIEIYRFFAKDLRTDDERPLEQKDFNYLAQQFPQLEHREYHLVSLFLFAARFVWLKLTGKAFPYWMDEVRQGKWFPRLLRLLQRLDEVILQTIPPLRKRCWMTVIRGAK